MKTSSNKIYENFACEIQIQNELTMVKGKLLNLTQRLVTLQRTDVVDDDQQ